MRPRRWTQRAQRPGEHSKRTIRSWVRRRRAAGHISMAVNLAPMIDVTFLLLIFFLVTTTFERAEGILASDLPKQTGRPSVALPISPIVIHLVPDGLQDEGFVITIDRFDTTPQSFSELSDFLRGVQAQPGFDDQTPVVIVSQNEVRWDHVVNCWNAALRAGFAKVAFAEP